MPRREHETEHRDSLSRLRSLLVLAQLMMQSTSEDQILQLAIGAARSLAPCTTADIDLDLRSSPAGEDHLDGGCWTYPIDIGRGVSGSMTVTCDSDLSEEAQFLLRSLAQHTGAAIANRRLHEQERKAAAEAQEARNQLQETLAVLQRSIDIHARLTEVAAAGEGREGIANAVHELTGLAVAVEDRFGNLRAWAGPNRPESYPKQSPARREELLRRAIKAGRPLRIDGGWIGVTQPQPDVIGALVLIDPEGSATDQQLTAQEHGLTVLALELVRLRSLAESELRVRRDLVEELLSGIDEESALRRAQALRYDLERPHRVVVVESTEAEGTDDAFWHAVRRAARDQPVGTLLVRRGSQVIVLADHEADWSQFRQSILAGARLASCRIGVGQTCSTVAEIPLSLRQAECALRLQKIASWADQSTCYDDLGVFQLLAEVQDPAATEAYVQRWLALLLEYDQTHHVDLVATLARFFECGGSYDATAATLFIHRSTLKYRLQRIREISGYDLNHPDTRFNLQLACRAWETLLALQRSG